MISLEIPEVNKATAQTPNFASAGLKISSNMGGRLSAATASIEGIDQNQIDQLPQELKNQLEKYFENQTKYTEDLKEKHEQFKVNSGEQTLQGGIVFYLVYRPFGKFINLLYLLR